MGGATLSGKALDCIRRMLKGEEVTQETSGMSKGEWREFQGVIGELVEAFARIIVDCLRDNPYCCAD